MGRSIRATIVAAFVVAIAGLAILASTAFASSYNGYPATHSCYSETGGIAHAYYSSAAGSHSNSAVIYYYGAYYC